MTSMFWFGINDKRVKDDGGDINWVDGYQKTNMFRKDRRNEFSLACITKILLSDLLTGNSIGDEKETKMERY